MGKSFFLNFFSKQKTNLQEQKKTYNIQNYKIFKLTLVSDRILLIKL